MNYKMRNFFNELQTKLQIMLIARTLKDKRWEKRDKIIERKKCFFLNIRITKPQDVHGNKSTHSDLKNYYNLKYKYNCSSFS